MGPIQILVLQVASRETLKPGSEPECCYKNQISQVCFCFVSVKEVFAESCY
jgi:hypothetical protein